MVSSPVHSLGLSNAAALGRQGLRDYSNLLERSLLLPQSPLFGTDGIRGKVGDILTEALAAQVGWATGQVLGSQPSHQQKQGIVILGMDSRNSSPALAEAIAFGLVSTGLAVWNLGLCPTPCVASLIPVFGAIGGVMISASHNPPEDNGIKLFGADGKKLSWELQAEIETHLRSSEPKVSLTPGKYRLRPELCTNYLASLQQTLPPNTSFQGMKIVLDMAWGAAVNVATLGFTQLGAEVISLHGQADGDRINVHCGSTHLGALQAAILEHQADLGFAFDGDADRLMAVDSQGRVIDGDYILYLWGKSLLEAGKLPENTIVTTVMANLGFEKAWEKLGGTFLRTAVGDQHVQAAMQTTGAMLGGEQSGHILCPHYSVSGDGLLVAMHLTSLVKNSGTSLAALRDASFSTYPQLLRNVRVESRETRLGWERCPELQQAIAQAEEAMAGQGRILVRASGTEPLIRVMVEAIEQSMVDYWAEQLVWVVETYLK
jgi:phosphoglucosamine mutase